MSSHQNNNSAMEVPEESSSLRSLYETKRSICNERLHEGPQTPQLSEEPRQKCSHLNGSSGSHAKMAYTGRHSGSTSSVKAKCKKGLKTSTSKRSLRKRRNGLARQCSSTSSTNKTLPQHITNRLLIRRTRKKRKVT